EVSKPAHLEVRANAPTDRSQFANQVFAGYQAWFAASGDGGLDRWFHWGNSTPSPGNVRVELYPDVREYNREDLFQTGLGALGNGQPAKLYSASHEAVIYTHFRWIKEYGIDGFAVQPFATEIRGSG